MNTPHTDLLRSVCAADTAHGEYLGGFHGHCGCVAYLLQQLLGGDIYVCQVTTYANALKPQKQERHYFLIDPRGAWHDPTKEQFTEEHFYHQLRKAPVPKTVNPRFKKYAERYYACLQ